MKKTNLLLIQSIAFAVALLGFIGPRIYEIPFWKISTMDTNGLHIALIAIFGTFAGFYFSAWLNSRKTKKSNTEQGAL